MNDAFDALSAEQRDRARRACVATFGSTPIDAVIPIAGGTSGASPFRVEVGGRRYLLRLEGPASPLRNPHQYVSMRMAAEAGLAPRIHYIDEADRVAVTDFVQQRPLRDYSGGPLGLAQALGEMLRRLQAAPLFPHFVN